MNTTRAAAFCLNFLLAASVSAQQLTPAERARIDSSALTILRVTQAPSASIAVVRGGQIVYEQAYAPRESTRTQRLRLRCAMRLARSASNSPPLRF